MCILIKITKTQIKTKKRNERRKLSSSSLSKNNDRFIKNLSKANLTDNQIKLLSKGIKIYTNRHNNEKLKNEKLKKISQGESA